MAAVYYWDTLDTRVTLGATEQTSQVVRSVTGQDSLQRLILRIGGWQTGGAGEFGYPACWGGHQGNVSVFANGLTVGSQYYFDEDGEFAQSYRGGLNSPPSPSTNVDSQVFGWWTGERTLSCNARAAARNQPGGNFTIQLRVDVQPVAPGAVGTYGLNGQVLYPTGQLHARLRMLFSRPA